MQNSAQTCWEVPVFYVIARPLGRGNLPVQPAEGNTGSRPCTGGLPRRRLRRLLAARACGRSRNDREMMPCRKSLRCMHSGFLPAFHFRPSVRTGAPSPREKGTRPTAANCPINSNLEQKNRHGFPWRQLGEITCSSADPGSRSAALPRQREREVRGAQRGLPLPASCPAQSAC